MKKLTLRASLVFAMLSVGSLAHAQEGVDPFETARFRWGPIAFTPTLEITKLGHDSNVFNETSDPKGDFTAAVGPAAKVWLRPGGTRLRLNTGAQYQYFHTYSSQRAWNTNNEFRWDVPLTWVTPFVGARFANSRERQGYEIDARSRRSDRIYLVGTSVRVSGKTELVGSFQRAELEYDDRETVTGAVLAQALNRREDTSKLQFRYALTPLTTFVTDVEVGRDRFEFAQLRDTDSFKVMPGFELKPFALVSGTVFVGYRQFEPRTSQVPDYRGVVAAVKARYLYSATRLDLRVERDLAYSFEEVQPYYALLDYGLNVTQRVSDRWDLMAEGSRQRLAYRSVRLDVLPDPPAGRRDRVDVGYTYGGGVGYRLTDSARVAFNVSHATRESDAFFRNYEGTRAYATISYGLQQ